MRSKTCLPEGRRRKRAASSPGLDGRGTLAVVTAGCFCVLAAFSLGRYHPDARPEHEEAAYDLAEVAQVNALAGHVPTLAERQAEAYRAVYGITAENMNAYKRWWR